jgi:hypothetical protein
MDLGKETTRTEGIDFSWMRSTLLASVDMIEFITTNAYLSLELG